MFFKLSFWFIYCIFNKKIYESVFYSQLDARTCIQAVLLLN